MGYSSMSQMTTHVDGHTLDLVFTNPYKLSINVKVNSDLSVSNSSSIKFDHFPVLFEITFSQGQHTVELKKNIKTPHRNIKQMDTGKSICHLGTQLSLAQPQLLSTTSFL